MTCYISKLHVPGGTRYAQVVANDEVTVREMHSPSSTRYSQVAAGDDYVALLTEEGGVVICGEIDNAWSSSSAVVVQKVSLNLTHYLTVFPVASLGKIAKIAGGAKHLLLLTSKGHVIALGSNEERQCCIPDWPLCDVCWMDIGAGLLHSVLISSVGGVELVGSNAYGQCAAPACATSYALSRLNVTVFQAMHVSSDTVRFLRMSGAEAATVRAETLRQAWFQFLQSSILIGSRQVRLMILSDSVDMNALAVEDASFDKMEARFEVCRRQIVDRNARMNIMVRERTRDKMRRFSLKFRTV